MFTTYTKETFDSSDSVTISSDVETPEKELVEKYQLENCIKWIRENDYKRTCLQFPESLLNDGTSIAFYLQSALGKTVYILADTSYGSCCIDEVAAQHVNGDSVIHFGHACLSPVIKLPVLYIFEKKSLDLDKLKKQLQQFDNNYVVVFYSDVYHHLYKDLNEMFKSHDNISISKLNLEGQVNENGIIICGRIFSTRGNSHTSAVYIGEDSVTLQNLVLGLPDFKWYHYNKDETISEYSLNRSKFLMQRSHLVEKIKEGNVIGILIGTLGIKNYLDAVERIKQLIKRKGKKFYILAVGKPNVAKLANFPEIDVFVCIACQENSLLKDFKDYYKPIVSLFEIEMALGERPFSTEYTSNFRELLPGGLFFKKSEIECGDENSGEVSQELMERHSGTLIESKGAQFLSNRSWRGLEQNLGETEVCKAVKGRSGIPQAYENELTTLSQEKNS